MSENVSVCVIVGNGFDMAAGLGTSANVFVERFAERHKGEDSPAGRLAMRIRDEGPENWADFEFKLGEYAAKIEESMSGTDGIAEFINAKSAMEDDLVAFVGEREALVDADKVEETVARCLDSLCGWLGALTPRDRKRFLGEFSSPFSFDFSFVTLNYTHVLDTMVGLQGAAFKSVPDDLVNGYRIHKCVHAHGDLDGNPICGVDNPSQICSEELAGDGGVLETVVKGSTQEMLGSLDDENAFALIRAAEVVMVYGCSLGETDSRWWKSVIEHLRSFSTKRFVVLFCHGFERNGCSAATVRNRINDLKERLFASAEMGDDEDKRQFFDRIFVLPSDVIFQMAEKLTVEP